jgi:hypothetical protein
VEARAPVIPTHPDAYHPKRVSLWRPGRRWLPPHPDAYHPKRVSPWRPGHRWYPRTPTLNHNRPWVPDAASSSVPRCPTQTLRSSSIPSHITPRACPRGGQGAGGAHVPFAARPLSPSPLHHPYAIHTCNPRVRPIHPPGQHFYSKLSFFFSFFPCLQLTRICVRLPPPCHLTRWLAPRNKAPSRCDLWLLRRLFQQP